MTAEIGVLNKVGVALAADSAVTIGNGQKIYNSANKLFALSKYYPVGLMIYGNASFLGIPWETLIKIYRQKLGEKNFPKLHDFSNHLIDFLNNGKYEELNNLQEQEGFALHICDLKLNQIRDYIIHTVKDEVNGNPDISRTEEEIEALFTEITENKINEELDNYNQKSFIEGFNEEDIIALANQNRETLYKKIDDKYEQLPLKKSLYERLNEICAHRLVKEFTDYKSGIVVAGFGENEIYPTLLSYSIEGKVNGKLKLQLEDVTEINSDCQAAITPFAQSEMVHTFMRGIDPQFRELSNGYLEQIFEQLPKMLADKIKGISDIVDESLYNSLLGNLNSICDKLLENYNESLTHYEMENHVHPIIAIVESLPKDELAEMAESLVSLTSFKRRVSNSLETVGGPVDVAVITKGDGFIWIKRKHYFNSDLNQQFFQKYLRSEQNDTYPIEK
ncbi:hypothetical protein [Priestia megaterium]|uniref:hypothetical protein n=1 Tax=Priestia megaterium TaxID=1404 RepID=UPI002813FEE0|nr:hypothetical protein [Priestia megaterium]MDR0128702.1 hypothetical protein [Priestia megaterium]